MLRPLAFALAGLLATSAFAQLKLPGSGGAAGASRPPGLTSPASTPPAPPPAERAAAERPAADKPAAEPARPDAAGNTAEMEQAAQLAAQGWLLLLDRRDWGTAYDTSAAMFRSAVKLPQWMDGIPKVRAPLGKVIERKPVEAVYRDKLQGRPDGDYVTILFATQFEKKPDAQEILTTVREPDGKWRVTGYSTR
ncbi:DUF4019 domain-containing protein [Ramlibacter rhizophilus]|uniref:DUF4019 domain-containing protein n=1 Tax=Ramlibacter rhizophilus TaxID=1781167 RepID=A0A4Z0BDV2_9BURK|nr:DUF4019 domain-containing protein [Ramlibacter rhizophilus]TFY96861.1 DUF4019 domain-containing protein [Ramlibacter rhizophilus]